MNVLFGVRDKTEMEPDADSRGFSPGLRLVAFPIASISCIGVPVAVVVVDDRG